MGILEGSGGRILSALEQWVMFYTFLYPIRPLTGTYLSSYILTELIYFKGVYG